MTDLFERRLRGTNDDSTNTDSSTNNIISEISNITIIVMAVLFFVVMVGCYLRAVCNPQTQTKAGKDGPREKLLLGESMPIPENKAVTHPI
jgi:hypothetical protein